MGTSCRRHCKTGSHLPSRRHLGPPHAIFNGADFTNAPMWDTSLGDCDLRLIKGLETIRHRGPSYSTMLLTNAPLSTQADSLLKTMFVGTSQQSNVSNL